MKNTALVGFSANAEQVQNYDRMNPLKKGRLTQRVRVDLCGTSANVARAIRKLGQKSKLLVLSGVNNDFESYTLRFALKECGIPFTEYKVLNHSHFAILPVDGISNPKTFGIKGTIERSYLRQTIDNVRTEKGKWRIATAVRPEEIELILSFFQNHNGFNSLNPRAELIEDTVAFKKVTKKSNLLIVNDSEYDACKTASIDDLHQFGPRLVIVTQRELGGIFSLYGHEPERFEACSSYINPETKICNPGSGDWFHAAFIVACMEPGKSILELTIEDVRYCVAFAARVAGKKVTMPGAANGPGKNGL